MKAAAIGIVSAVLVAVLWIVAALWLPIYADMFFSYLKNEGGSAAVAYVGSGSVILAALIGFTGGLYLTLRRARRQRSPTSN